MFALDGPTPALFSGDVAFCSMCGANFEGTVCEIARAFATLWRGCCVSNHSSAEGASAAADRWLLFPGHEVGVHTLSALRDSVESDGDAARSVFTPGGGSFERLEAMAEAARTLRRCKPPQPIVPHRLADELQNNLSFLPLRGAAAELTMACRQALLRSPLLPPRLPPDAAPAIAPATAIGDAAAEDGDEGEGGAEAAAELGSLYHVPWVDADGKLALYSPPPPPPSGGCMDCATSLCRSLFSRRSKAGSEGGDDADGDDAEGLGVRDASAVDASETDASETDGSEADADYFSRCRYLPPASVDAYFAKPDEEASALLEVAVTATEVKEAFKLMSAFAFVPPYLHVNLLERLLTCRWLQPVPLSADEWHELRNTLEPFLTRERTIGFARFCEALQLDAGAGAASHGRCGRGAGSSSARAQAMRKPPPPAPGDDVWSTGFRRLFPGQTRRRTSKIPSAPQQHPSSRELSNLGEDLPAAEVEVVQPSEKAYLSRCAIV